MPNVKASPAGNASASLAAESSRKPKAPSVATEVQSPKALTLATGEQVQLESYTVRKGDTLWDIAGVKMGNPNNWPILFALNKDKIKNPDMIHPGQVLTVPTRMPAAAPAAPAVGQPVDMSPAAEEPIPPQVPAAETAPAVDTTPAEPIPAQPAAPAAVEEEIVQPQAPAVEAQAPAVEAQAPAIEAPVVETPAPPTEPAAETVPEAVSETPAAPLLRPPDQLPQPAEEVPAPVVESQPPAQPVQPEIPAEAPKSGLTTIGQPTQAQNKGSGLGKAALIGGAIGTAGTGALLIGVTAKLSTNLGGYATAQVVAKSVNAVTSKVGLSLPTGPALTKLVSKVGGPKVAGTVAAVGTGLVVAGLAAGGYYLYKKATDKGETPAPAKTPAAPPAATPAAEPATPAAKPAAPAAAVQPLTAEEENWAVDLQTKITQNGYQPTADEVTRYNGLVERSEAAAAAPAPTSAESAVANAVIDPKSKPPVDVTPQFNQLEKLLSQKKYYIAGGPTEPEKIRETGVQIWLDGKLDDKVKLANLLVSHGQSELLGRVMGHQETSPEEVAQVMSQPQFPVGEFMKGLDDNHAFLVLNSLASVASTGEKGSAGVISQTVKAYDGWRDREAPFTRLKNQLQSQGSWEQLPADLRGQIDQLLK